MFENLSQRLGDTFDRLKKRGALSEEDVGAALREIRIALLEADVALPVVKQFIDGVRPKAIGEDVLRSVTPAQMVVKIVHDHLIETLGQGEPLEPQRGAAGADPDAGPARLGQDHDRGQARAALEGARAQEGAARLARRASPGRAGTARDAGEADRRPVVAGGRGRTAGRDRQARDGCGAARGLRRGDPRHRGPPPYRRSADVRGRGGAATQ